MFCQVLLWSLRVFQLKQSISEGTFNWFDWDVKTPRKSLPNNIQLQRCFLSFLEHNFSIALNDDQFFCFSAGISDLTILSIFSFFFIFSWGDDLIGLKHKCFFFIIETDCESGSNLKISDNCKLKWPLDRIHQDLLELRTLFFVDYLFLFFIFLLFLLPNILELFFWLQFFLMPENTQTTIKVKMHLMDRGLTWN